MYQEDIIRSSQFHTGSPKVGTDMLDCPKHFVWPSLILLLQICYQTLIKKKLFHLTISEITHSNWLQPKKYSSGGMCQEDIISSVTQLIWSTEILIRLYIIRLIRDNVIGQDNLLNISIIGNVILGIPYKTKFRRMCGRLLRRYSNISELTIKDCYLLVYSFSSQLGIIPYIILLLLILLFWEW